MAHLETVSGGLKYPVGEVSLELQRRLLEVFLRQTGFGMKKNGTKTKFPVRHCSGD